MDIAYVGQLVATAIGGAGLKPVFDYMSGRTKAKVEEREQDRARITELEKARDAAAAKEEQRQVDEQRRLDERREREEQRQQDEHRRSQAAIAREQIFREEMAALQQTVGKQSNQLVQLENQVADLQADKDELQAELVLTKQHVVDLQDQVKSLGGEPRQPRRPDGKFDFKPTKGKR